MAVANPLLATLDSDGTLRTFEFTSGSFVQLASKGPYPHNPAAASPYAANVPFLAWNQEGNLSMLRAPSNTQNSHRIETPMLAFVNEIFQTGTTNRGGGFYAFDYARNWAAVISDGAGSIQYSDINPDTGAAGAFATLWANSFANCIDFSFDGLYLFWGTDTDRTPVIRKWGGSGYSVTVSPLPTFTQNAELVAFAKAGYTFVTLDVTNSRGMVWAIDPETDEVSLVHEPALPVGTLTAIRMCRDGRRMAISALNGGVYTTFVYQRSGTYWLKTQEIASFGKLLEFSVEGSLLIDCGLRVCQQFNGAEYAPLAGAMNNITTIVQSAALDRGFANKDGQPSIYDAGLDSLTSGAVNLGSLKFTLLTASAVFDKTQTTLAQVTNNGAYEITGGMWPAGGVPLTGVARAGDFWLTVDPVTRVIVDTGFTARYAVVYDAADNDRPLFFIDFLEDKAISKDTELTINFLNGRLVFYDR